MTGVFASGWPPNAPIQSFWSSIAMKTTLGRSGADKAASGASAVASTLSVSIDKDGKFYLDAKELTLEQMRTNVRAAYAKDNDTRAVIAADGRVSHSHVVQVIDLLRQEKVTKFAINVRPEDLGGAKK